MKLVYIPILILISFSAQALENDAYTRSAGNYRGEPVGSLEQRLRYSAVEVIAAESKPRHGHGSATTGLSPRLSRRHVEPVEFLIFEAWAELSGDIDRDGYFHRINVVFDADVNTALETVYVKLYLSRDGGDWLPYASSDLFQIRYDDTADTYEVVTELVEGYPPGYYDVLIELHALNHDGVVASRIVMEDEFGDVISLEDSAYDQAYVETVTSITTIETRPAHGGGSLSLAGLVMYGLLLIIKLRYFPSIRSRRT